MKILIVGAGAIGGYFGAKLAQASRDVTFLVRPARASQLQRDGLQIISPEGNFTVQPKTITSQEIHSAFDAILLSVKAPSLNSAITDMKPAVGPDTIICPALNGLQHIAALSQAFGQRAVLGGVAIIATMLDDQGRILQLNKSQKFTYGELDGQITARIQAFHQTMSNAGFDAELSSHIMQDMWDKWVMIATLGLNTCLLNGNIGQINAVPDGEAVILQSIDECAGIAKAAGYPTSKAVIDMLRQTGADKNSKLTSSMFRDMQSGANVEVEAILGDLLKHGQAHQLKTPLLQAACVRLRIYQKSRSVS
jgi:2-dehydropantoate 2-reductase